MKKVLLIALGAFFMSGCLVRTYVADRNRVDQDMQGNHGYIMGKQTSNEGRVFKFGKMRKVAVIEVETGSHQPKEKSNESISSSDESSSEPASSSSSSDYSSSSSSTSETFADSASESSMSAGKDVSYTEYTIQKNDTLQKVSQKFYGTTKKWMMLYNENKDVLSSPNKIYPGLVIKVPNKK
jgi:nucleoid-associated protein YgaU